ncbi:MAG: hypothetical protein MZW92_76510 [Comamonadaceae bacterium]|nr:hypothetical protein [Comamonadaceae bacterium]
MTFKSTKVRLRRRQAGGRRRRLHPARRDQAGEAGRDRASTAASIRSPRRTPAAPTSLDHHQALRIRHDQVSFPASATTSRS